MPQAKGLTNSSDETELGKLLGQNNLFTIPYFQRAYKWKSDKLTHLNKDILETIDQGSAHFLGAIIMHGRRSNPSDAGVYDIIDGQQRITTLMLYIAALVKTYTQEKEYKKAVDLFLRYLVYTLPSSRPSNIKLYSCKEDRGQINAVFEDLLSNKTFSKELRKTLNSFKNFPPASDDKSTGRIKLNYNAAKRFLKDQLEVHGLQRIDDITNAILFEIYVVQIDVWDPTNGPKIFDALNSRQEPMTIGDLVRNEIFSRADLNQPDVVERIDTNHWQPFYKKFKQNGKDLFDGYFFPYGLIQDPNLKKSEVYGHLVTLWHGIRQTDQVIDQLAVYQNAYIDIVSGSNLQSHHTDVTECFNRLTNAQLPTSTYPFLMQLSNAISQGKVTTPDGVKILTLIESFLVRRAVCGYEPTGLHAVFKRLWKDCRGNPTKKLVKAAIRNHTTVQWPDDSVFTEAIKNRHLYTAGITKFLLSQYEKSLQGDQGYGIPWVEHVLPDTSRGDWDKLFTKSQHAELKDTLANLIPLSAEMNRSLSNSDYSKKRPKYQNDSSFKSAREFARTYQNWTPTEVEARAKLLSNWAVNTWAD